MKLIMEGWRKFLSEEELVGAFQTALSEDNQKIFSSLPKDVQIEIAEKWAVINRVQILGEVSYKGNIGFQEIAEFYLKAPDELTDKFEEVMKAGSSQEAMAIVQDFLGVELVGDEFSKPAAAMAEGIELDIEVGDILLGGKYKNKRIEVKKIGVDDIGQPTINGKSLLKFRIEKQLPDSKKSKKTKDAEKAEEEESEE